MRKDISKEAREDVFDVSLIDLAPLPSRAFPVKQAFRIFVSEQAHTDIWQHARGTLIAGAEVKEVGGMLIGNIYKDEQGPYLDVKAAIIAEHTRNEGTEVAFTPETWAQVNRVKDERYPDERIVGWYHTHPRFGIFLSERDVFIQRHSFSQPWAIAFVVDPVQKTEGFFYWRENEPKEADEYWVGQEHHQCVPKVEPTDTNDESSAAKVDTKAAVSQLSAAISTTIGLLALIFAIGYIYWQNYKQFERDKILLRGLQSQSADLDLSLQTLNLLKRSVPPAQQVAVLPAVPAEAKPDPQVAGLLQELERGLQRLGAHSALLAAQIAGQETNAEAGKQ